MNWGEYRLERERDYEFKRMRGKGIGENKGNRELRKGRKKDWRG
jgi:hypothetical protein